MTDETTAAAAARLGGGVSGDWLKRSSHSHSHASQASPSPPRPVIPAIDLASRWGDINVTPSYDIDINVFCLFIVLLKKFVA